MIKKHSLLIAGLGALLFASCQNGGGNNNVIGSWKGVKLETPEADSMDREMMKQFDTITVANEMMKQQFGTTNVDSIKQMMKMHLEKQTKDKEEYVSNLKYEIKQGGVVYNHNSSPTGVQTDSSKWYFADNGKKIVFDEAEMKNGKGDRVIFDIVKATGDSLSLKLIDPRNGAIVFHFTKDNGSKEAKKEEKK